MNLNEHERIVELKPIGIKYICESCNEGEMIVDNREPIVVPFGGRIDYLRPHVCNKCGMKMQLPKSYPYIEWITEDEYKELMEKKDYTEVDNDSTKVHVDNV